MVSPLVRLSVSLRRAVIISACAGAVCCIPFFSGCGGSSGTNGSGTPPPTGDTIVTVYVSSSANNELIQFNLGISGISLTDKSGKSVALPLPTPAQNPTGNLLEFEHLNGTSEPLLTGIIPSGTYTGMKVEVAMPSYGCSTLISGGIHSFDGIPALPSSAVSVNFPSPITISGSSMALRLHLNVSDSFPLSSCSNQGFNSNTPLQAKFTLTRLALASPPTNRTNGLSPNLLGTITAVSGGSMTVLSPDGLSWTAALNGGTALQGVSSLSALKAGMPVYLDLALQPGNSPAATLVDVLDTNVSNVSMAAGSLLFVANQVPTIQVTTRLRAGSLFSIFASAMEGFAFNDSQAAFQIAGPVPNLKNLPFQATFDAATLVAGQNLAITTEATSRTGGPNYHGIPASTITLLPQTIDATVTSTGTAGGFTTYTVQLASYNAFPTFAVQAGQTTQLTAPSTVVVYADSNTQMLNSTPVATGSLLRFTGLVFNDNGALRMDCFSVANGVAES